MGQELYTIVATLEKDIADTMHGKKTQMTMKGEKFTIMDNSTKGEYDNAIMVTDFFIAIFVLQSKSVDSHFSNNHVIMCSETIIELIELIET